MTSSAVPPPIRASSALANVTPSVGGWSVATSAADTAACWANICPEPSSRATVMASATTRASCQAPVPTTSTRRSPTAIPSVTPTITSTARRPRWPRVSPSVMIADTGAKNGWAWPTTFVATSQAMTAARVTWAIDRAASFSAFRARTRGHA